MYINLKLVNPPFSAPLKTQKLQETLFQKPVPLSNYVFFFFDEILFLVNSKLIL